MLTRAFDVAQGLAWPERWPGRALANAFTRAWHGREDELRCDAAASRRVVDARAHDDLNQAPLYAGEPVGLVTAERSATDLVRELSTDAEQVLRRVPDLLS
ncbi:hypothetical protein [Blastococcus sp. SYSU DS0973]